MRTVITQTDGKGYWSGTQARVPIIKAILTSFGYDTHNWVDAEFAELRAVFDTKDWNTRDCGFIYTDKTWLRTWRRRLQEMGFSRKATDDVSYSEQGMQGRNFVSMDVGPRFIQECDPLLRFTTGIDPLADFLIIDP